MPWDVFISHASEDKNSAAEPLAEALISAGLTVWYDRFELKIGDSLRRSIDEGLSNSRFGVVLLSPSFFSKHWPQLELDGLAQREVDGRKVILPVWLNITPGEIRRASPPLADRVAARWADGIAKVVQDLLKVVNEVSSIEPASPAEMNQPDVSSTNLDSLVLLMSSKEGVQLFASDRIRTESVVELVLIPEEPRGSAFLAALRNPVDQRVGIAFGYSAMLGTVQSVSQVRERGHETWSLQVRPENTDYGASSWEMAFGQYSADQLAEMRARRILLDEKLPGGERKGDLNATILEAFVRGQSTPLQVEHSPLPLLFKDLGTNTKLFLAAATLLTVLWLRLSGVVEHILKLDLSMSGERVLSVSFEGKRKRKYSNVDPTIIRVEGICQLSGA